MFTGYTPSDLGTGMGWNALREVYARRRRHWRGKRGERTLWVHAAVSKHQVRQNRVKIGPEQEEGQLNPICEKHKATNVYLSC